MAEEGEKNEGTRLRALLPNMGKAGANLWQRFVARLLQHPRSALATLARKRRDRFRRKHHYFNYLKYWSLYQDKFDYLDSKSQALLSASSIMTAVFAIMMSIDAKGEVALERAKYLSYLGVLLLAIAQIALLRCLRTTAHSSFKRFIKRAKELEAKISDRPAPASSPRNRILEANFDFFLTNHLRMVNKAGYRYSKSRDRLSKIWPTIAQNKNISFKDFEHDVSEFFGKLRSAVEAEIDRRHFAYGLARRIVLLTLLILIFNLFLNAMHYGALGHFLADIEYVWDWINTF